MTDPTENEPLRVLLTRWREDSGGAYRTWFLWGVRLKNFRSIRRGIASVVKEIEDDTFGNEIRNQLNRPAFSGVTNMRVRYLPYGELATHRDSIIRIGTGLKPIESLAKSLR